MVKHDNFNVHKKVKKLPGTSKNRKTTLFRGKESQMITNIEEKYKI